MQWKWIIFLKQIKYSQLTEIQLSVLFILQNEKKMLYILRFSVNWLKPKIILL